MSSAAKFSFLAHVLTLCRLSENPPRALSFKRRRRISDDRCGADTCTHSLTWLMMLCFTVLMLATVSVVWGLALAIYYFEWPTLGVSGVILTTVAVALLYYDGFGFFAGVGIVVGCVSLNQIVYLIGTVIVSRGSQDSASNCVSSDAQQNAFDRRIRGPQPPNSGEDEPRRSLFQGSNRK